MGKQERGKRAAFNKSVICYVSEAAFGPHLRMGTGCQENQPCD